MHYNSQIIHTDVKNRGYNKNIGNSGLLYAKVHENHASFGALQ